MIVATAGHVDHGKTTLVRVLTGVDTDRLPEEKRRGMSIDLGFAYLRRAGGEAVAFVDVPGHERFVRNMTAGVQGIDLALLVVAADDGPMPQTREHLEILEQLGAPRLIAVLSKIDRVSPERTIEAIAELRSVLAEGRFGEAEILPLSSLTGEGMEALRARLAACTEDSPPRHSTQRFRLHVDRAFIIDGHGLVATGTVISGTVAVGDEVQLLPSGRTARVRSLRANDGEAARAAAGQRCALALHGFSRGDVARGDVLADLGPAPRSHYIDVLLEPLRGGGRVAARGGQVGVHLGTAHLAARLTPLERDAPRFARLSFTREISAWRGDRLLLRDPGSGRLAAAGAVLDPMPPQRGAASTQRLATLAVLAEGSAEQCFDALLGAQSGMLDVDWFAACFHLPPAELRRLEGVRPLAAFAQRGARHLMPEAAWRARCDALERAVADWHVENPDSIGPRPAQLDAPLAPAIDFLIEAERLVREGPHLRLPTHRPRLSAQDEALWEAVAPLLAGSAGRPPRVRELAEPLGMEPEAVAEFLQRAARAGRAYRVTHNRFFLPGELHKLVELAVALDEGSEQGGFTAADYRDRSGLGRNLTIEVLEFLDQAGYTRRVGAARRARLIPTEEKRPRWGARTSNSERGV